MLSIPLAFVAGVLYLIAWSHPIHAYDLGCLWLAVAGLCAWLDADR